MDKRLTLAWGWALAASLAWAMEYRQVKVEDAPFAMPAIPECVFPARDFSIVDFGARPGVKCTEALARAMAACEAAGGGRVVVPDGSWITGAIRFRSNCNLHLAAGAIIEFTDDPADYPVVHTTWEGVECLNLSPLVFAYEVENIAITGQGLFRPKMDRWRSWFTRPPAHLYATECLYHWCSTNAPMAARDVTAIKGSNVRPHLIQINRAKNVLLDGFRIKESPFWMIHLYHSENCIVRNLDTCAHGHNNDGVDVDMTKNVLIEKCRFDQGDDGICLKAGRNADAWRLNRPTENVVVRDCDLVRSHSLLGIGSELSGGIRNVWMTRCKVQSTGGAVRIKTNRRRGGFVENIYLDHCQAGDLTWVFGLGTDVLFQWKAFPDYELRYTRIRNINISDLTCDEVRVAFDVQGDRHLPVEGLHFRNISINRVGKAFSDIKNCSDITFDNVRLAPADPDYRPPEVELMPIDDRFDSLSPAHAAAVKFLNDPKLKTLGDGRYELGGGAFAEIGMWTCRNFNRDVEFKDEPDYDTFVAYLDPLEGERFFVGKYAKEMSVWGDYYIFFPAGLRRAEQLTNRDDYEARRITVKVPVAKK